MADIAQLGFRVDSSGLRRAATDLDALRSSGERATRTNTGLSGSFTQMGSVATSSASAITQSLSQVKNQMLALAGISGVVGSSVSVIKMADEYKNLEAKLHLVTKSQQEFNDVQGKLSAMADANRQSLSATVNLYSGIAPSLQKAGQSQEDILKAVDSVNKALVVGGSTAQGSAASILQLTQALGSGVLRGDEFNSIMENGRGIALMLADALHTDVGKLRGLAEQGKLTANIVTAALIEQNDAISKKFATMPVTVGQAIQVVENNLLRYIGSADSASGATAALSSSLITLSKNLDTVANVGAVIATVYGARLIGSLSAYAATNIAASAAVRTRGAAELAAATQTAQAEAVVADARAIHTTILLREAEAAVAASSGMARLRLVETTLIPAQQAATLAAAEATAATAAHAAALRAQANAGGLAATAMRGLSTAMAMVGGPVGALVLALAGVAYYISESNAEFEKSKDSIKNAKGEWVKYVDITDQAKQINEQYLGASASVRKELKEQSEALQKNTQDAYDNAKSKLALLEAELAKAKTQVLPAYDSNGEAIYTADNGYAVDQQGAQQAEIDVATKRLSEQQKVVSELKKQLEGVKEAHNNLGKATDAGTKSTKDSALELLNQGNVTKKSTEAIHAHGDAMQKATESLIQRTLKVKEGVLAEQYYIERMNGVTDAEARRIVSGNQYLTYLEEQQNLTKDATAAHGGLLDAYRQKLDDAGLGSANDAFDAAKSSTDMAVDAAKRYKESIEAVTKAAKEAAQAVAGMSSAQPASVNAAGTGVDVKSGGGKQSQTLTDTIAAAAAKHPQVIAVIDKVAKDTGNDPAVMKAMAYIESRFNDKAYNRSSASGVYQFVDGTARQYGLSGKQFDAESNARAYTKLLEDNAAALKRYGIEVTGANLYLAHQQGAGGLKQIMDEAAGRAQVSATVRRNMSGNPSGGDDSTAAGFLKGWTDKYNSIEASVNAAIKPTAALAVQSSAVAEQTTKAAEYAKKAPPIWDELNQKADEAKKLTVEYGGEIENKVVTAQMRANLEQRYMTGEAQKLIDAAALQAKSVGKTGIVIRQNELDQKQFNVAQQTGIINAESALAYAQEEANLRKEMAAVKQQGLASQYAAGLSDKTLTADQIRKLTNQKMEIQFQSNMSGLDDRAAKATMTADAYKRMTLERDGFTKAQVDGQMAWEHEVSAMEHARELADGMSDVFRTGITSAMQDMVKTGNSILDQLIGKLLESLMTSKAMEQVFSNFGSNFAGSVSGITSLFGFADGGQFGGGSAIRAYANGDAFHNSVLTKPTLFKVGGKQAVAGEAGAEAVMPMPNGGVLAQVGNDVVDLPLTRANGKLAVDLNKAAGQFLPFADGGQFGGGRDFVNSGVFSKTVISNDKNAGDMSINMPVNLDARGATPETVGLIQQQLSALEARIYQSVPGLVRRAQLANRQRPTI